MFATLALLLGCVAFADGPLAPAPSEQDPTVELGKRYAQEALERASSPRGAVPLIRLHQLRNDVEDLNLLAETYFRILTGDRVDPTVRQMARIFSADIERARGKTQKAQELLAPLGFVTDFYVVGGFDNEGKSGCDTAYGPESPTLNLSAGYPGKGREVSWHRIPVEAPDGYVDLGQIVRPAQESVAYALTFLEAKSPSTVALAVGASGAFRLYVNGAKVLTDDHYHFPSIDQGKVAVQLKRGLNRVLLKICQDHGPFGFYLRRERYQGSALPNVVLAEKPPPLNGPFKAAAVALPTLTQKLKRELEKSKPNPQLLSDYATVLSFSHDFDEKERLDSTTAEDAAARAPTDPWLQLYAASLQRDDFNLRRQHIERVLSLLPRSPYARLMLAQEELNRDRPFAALDQLNALLGDFPDFKAAQLVRIRALEATEQSSSVLLATEALFRSAKRLPRAAQEAARASRMLDRPKESVERLRVALALRYDDPGSRRGLSSALADLGLTDDAAAELRAQLRLQPFDNAARLSLAELLSANGKLEDAAQTFAVARALSPDEPEVHEREGRALLNAGRKTEAVAAFERSLALRPQNPQLKEALRSILGAGAAPLAFAEDIRPLIFQADAYAHEDAVYLVDNSYTRVEASGLSSKFQQVAVKVFTQRGVEAFRTQPITYAPDRQEVRVLKARVLKPDGSVVDAYSESERNLNEPWTGMYYDTRAKLLSFPALSPGDVLELQYKLEDTAQDNLLSDYWGEVESIQALFPKLHFQFAVEMPASRPLYWNKSHLGSSLQVKQEALADDRRRYRFFADSVPKFVPEVSMPGWAEVAATLHVSTYRAWEDVGRYYWGLVREQLLPNEELKKTVSQLLSKVNRKDELAVVRALYSFVVSHTRYVALEFGIHGYKPYRVDRILSRRFGDCKDKASLLFAMLKTAGVDSRLVLLRMRQLGNIGEDPASLAAFNHAILYVPKLDLFLDGTAEFHGAAELPSADRAANILVVDPDGYSRFFSTPESLAENNKTELRMEGAVAEDGSAKFKGQTVISGQQAPDFRRTYQTAATRKAIFEQSWGSSFPGLAVEDLKVSDLSQLDQPVLLDFHLSIPRFAEVLDGGLRFYPFGTARAFAQAFAPLKSRQYDLVLSGPFSSVLSYQFTLPKGYSPVGLPFEVDEVSPFGRVHLTIAVKEGLLRADGEVTISQGRIQATDYPAFRKWLLQVDRAFGRKVTLKRGPSSPLSLR